MEKDGKRPIWTGTSKDGKLIAVKSCGFLLCTKVNGKPGKFLVLGRLGSQGYDLPKGHREEGETDIDTASRELFEETGIDRDQIEVIEGFSYQSVYYPTYKRFGGQKVEKSIVIFAAFLKESDDVENNIRLTEHKSFHWEDWAEKKDFRNNTIQEAKRQLNAHLGD